MSVFADENEDPLLFCRSKQPPRHAELAGCAGKVSAQAIEVERNAVDRLELDPHEEHAARPVAELLALDDIAVMLSDEGCEGAHYARPVGTRQRQDVVGDGYPRRAGGRGHGHRMSWPELR